MDADLRPDSPTRTKIDLSGIWSLSTDGGEWQNVNIPASIDESGTFTFRRTFALTDQQILDQAFKFVALGINYDAEIYVNDNYVGRHIGGFSSFEFEVPDNALAAGSENALQIVVHNRLTARSTVPIRKQSEGWRTYGGIIRGLYLLGTPRLWIDRLTPRIAFAEDVREGRISVQTLISNRGFAGLSTDSVTAAGHASFLFGLELIDRTTDAVVAQSAPQVLTLESGKDLDVQSTLLLAGARVWRVDQPDLYIIRATVFTQEARQRNVVDQEDRLVGFPAVTIRKNQFYENGVRLRLRGVSWHEDDPIHGASLTYEQMDRDLATIKSIGANVVRFAFHPPHPYLLNLCARYGLYALVEAPVWNVPASTLAEESFRAVADPMIREMVERDASNPAVLAWGVGDHLDASDARTAVFARETAAIIRSLDRRPVYVGTFPVEQDATIPAVDIAAVHLPATDLRSFRTALQRLRTTYTDRPVVVLSYGIPVDHANRSGYRDPRSQEFQARYYLQHIAAVKESGIAGACLTAFADWRGDRPLLTVPSGDRTMTPLGIVSASREKRLALDVVRAQYQDLKYPAIPAGTYRAAFPAAHVITGLIIIIIFGYQYSYNRRFGEAVKRSFLRSYNFFADLRDRRDVPILASVILAVCLAVTVSVVFSSILYHYRTDAVADELLSALIVNDVVKEQINAAAWEPVRGIAMMSVLLLAFFGFVSILIKVVAWVVRVKITLGNAWLLTIWGILPVIVLSPVGMSLFKIMESSVFVIPSMVLVALVLLWAGLRVLKAMSVVFDISPAKTYVIAIMAGVLLLGSALAYLESSYALRATVEHILSVSAAQG